MFEASGPQENWQAGLMVDGHAASVLPPHRQRRRGAPKPPPGSLPTPQTREYLSPEEAGDYLGVGPAKIREMMASGLRYTDLGYRTPRIRRAWIDEYMMKRSTQHATQRE